MGFDIFSDDEIRITSFKDLDFRYILFKGERFDLVKFDIDKSTKKRTFSFVKTFFNYDNSI